MKYKFFHTMLLTLAIALSFNHNIQADPRSNDQKVVFNIIEKYYDIYFDSKTSHKELSKFFKPEIIYDYPKVDFEERFVPFGLVWVFRAPAEVRYDRKISAATCEFFESTATAKESIVNPHLCINISGKDYAREDMVTEILFELIKGDWLMTRIHKK